MISRNFHDLGWAAGCAQAPPPLHVYDTQSIAAAWHPLPRVTLLPQHPGPEMVKVPAPGGFAGDDPTDPAGQTIPRISTMGMCGRLHQKGVSHR